MQSTSLIRRVTTVVAGAASATAAVVAPLAAHAGSAIDNITNQAKNTATAGSLTGGTTDLGTLVGRFISAALGLLGIVLVVIVIYAGFLWMTAQGNDEKVKQAKKMISNAVVGLVLIFAAYAITNFVLSAIGTATS